MTIKLSDEIKEEIKRLREEIANLKAQLRTEESQLRRRPRGIYIDIGNNIRGYVEDTLESVAENIHGELEKSIFIGPGGVRMFKLKEPFGEMKIDFAKAAEIMSALGQEHRLRILKELASGGKYINELQETLRNHRQHIIEPSQSARRSRACSARESTRTLSYHYAW